LVGQRELNFEKVIEKMGGSLFVGESGSIYVGVKVSENA